ncbi:MAG: addiction module toxin RelE [Chloroflexi bacterium]|nr:addiction module toxin RelE [Chloroflexota bacterium]
MQTTNRKIMAPNPLGATWELRVGDLRVYYDLREDDAVVEIIAFGEKVRDRVRIGGQYVDLRAEND